MYSQRDVMAALESVRKGQKITIADFTHGIISRREYSRYLSSQTELSLKVLAALLDRLHLALHDFSYYLFDYSCTLYTEEAELFMNLELGDYTACERPYQILKTRKAGGPFASHFIPMALLYLDYRHDLIGLAEAQNRAKEILPLSCLSEGCFLNEDQAVATMVYSLFADPLTARKISRILFPLLLDATKRVLFMNYETGVMALHLTYIRSLNRLKQLEKEDWDDLKKAVPAFLSFHRRARIEFFDEAYFLELEDIYKKNRRMDSSVAFYSSLTALQHESAFPPLAAKAPTVNPDFIERLEQYENEPPYGEIIDHGIHD
jgi:hypothetical protein